MEMAAEKKTYYSSMLQRKVEYTVVPLDLLDEVRAKLHEKLAVYGGEYTIRTFYAGPRHDRSHAQTLKSDAKFAKIGIYKKYVGKYGTRDSLWGYL
jgi:hypothetical protein